MLSHSSFAVWFPWLPWLQDNLSQTVLFQSSHFIGTQFWWLSPGSSLKAFFKILSSETPPELLNEFWTACSKFCWNGTCGRWDKLCEYLQELIVRTCSHIVWFWFWRSTSWHTLTKHPRVTLPKIRPCDSCAKAMQMHHFGFASTSLSHVSEMPQRCRQNPLGWFTDSGSTSRLWLTAHVKVLSASHIKLRGWRARLLRLPESLPLSSHPAQGKTLRVWRNANS